MPEIAELLERTTPRRPPAFDVADLARRGRCRRLRALVGTGMGAVAVVALAATGLGLVTPDEEGLVVASRPPTGELAEAFAAAEEPLGTWEQVADPPFSPRMSSFTGTASDGRVVVWGGSPATEGVPWTLTDGGVYDPKARTWEAIPAAPVPAGLMFHPDQTQLADDRLMVLGISDGADPVVAAVYDLTSQEWVEIEPPPTIDMPVDGVVWTGDSLVLAQFYRFDQEEGAFARAPAIERWSLETGEWTAGAKPPLAPRRGAAVASDGTRLGVWGGSNDRLLDDGAIYDIAADRWSMMAPGSLPPTAAATAVWLGGDLIVSAGHVIQGDRPSKGMVSGYPEMPGLLLVPSTAAAAAYDPTEGTWATLSEAPSTPDNAEQGVPYRVFGDPERPFLAVDPRESGPHPMHVYDEVTRSWIEAPLRDLHDLGGTLVATSRTRDNPGGDPFEVRVLAGSVWELATEAPFTNRMDAGVAVTGQGLLVVGGAEGPGLDITGDAWLLRFDVGAGD